MIKASSLKPRPIPLYLKAQINGKNISCLVDARATNSFMSLKLAKNLGLPTRRVSKSTNMRFAKGEQHKIKEVTLHVTLKCKTLEFVENFILCEMNEVDLIFGDIFF